MKSLRFNEYGSAEVLRIEDLPTPEPGAGEILVRVSASGISPSDIAAVAGKLHSQLPRTPGRDYAGVVVKGEGWAGKEVWGTGTGFGITRDGCHAEFLLVPIDSCSEKPSNLTMEQAASIGIPYLTAWASLIQIGNLQGKERILITGANGSVGRAATQIARWKGASVFGADLTDQASEANTSINIKQQDLQQAIHTLTNGEGVDLVLDTVGGNLFEQCLGTLRHGGRQVAIASAGQAIVNFDLVKFYQNQSQLLGVDTVKLGNSNIAEIMRKLRTGFETGHLKPPTISTSPLSDAAAVYEGIGRGTLKGKQVLTMLS